MANEQERLQALVNAGVATDADKARLRKLIEEGEITEAEAVPKPEPAPTKGKKASEPIQWRIPVDAQAFKKGGQQYYPPKKDGFHKSAIIDIVRPDFTEKEQVWFVFATTDDDAGRGAVVCELGRGSFKVKDVLDGVGIPYTLNEETEEVDFSIAHPFACWADWQRDPKGLGGVKIGSLKPADANIEQSAI